MNNFIVTHENNFLIQPQHINTKQRFWNAFGHCETESSAYWVVKFCQKNDGWVPFTYEEINEFYRKEGKFDHKFKFNRLVDPESVVQNLGEVFNAMTSSKSQIHGLIASAGVAKRELKGGGWILLGDDEKYRVTCEFITKCFQSSPKDQYNK